MCGAGTILVNLIQRLVESVLFFHPIVWIVSAGSKEREHCCDAIVVRQTGKARAYVETLPSLSRPRPRPRGRCLKWPWRWPAVISSRASGGESLNLVRIAIP